MTSKIDNASKNTQNSKPLIRNAWLLALLLLILALEVVRSVNDVKRIYEEAPIQNIVPQELLAPRLLD